MKTTHSSVIKAFRLSNFSMLIFLAFLLTSCLEVKQAIDINKDGSGDTRLEVAVQKEWAPQAIPKLKADIPKGWNIIEEKDKEGKHIIVLGRKFKDISELNDNKTRYVFSSERKGFLKKSYNIEVSYRDTPSIPFEVVLKVPGSIDETDGTKVSSSEVKWNLQGFRKGMSLTVKSSAFALPDFASLKESFNRVFDSLFYREAVVILQPGPEGKDTFYGTVYIPNGGPNNTSLYYGGWGDWYFDYFEFDLTNSPDATDVSNATFNIYVNGLAPNDPSISVYRITENWSEDDVTREHNPDSVFYKKLPPLVNGWNTVDITDLYKNWKSGAYRNCGIKLVPTKNNQTNGSFASSDNPNSNIRPKLVINTATPRIAFISAGAAKIIILSIMAMTGILLIFGIVLMTRKAIKAVVPKRKTVSKGIFCTQCGKENSPAASFCVNCGQKLQ
jgi:hypothetical protein